MVIPLKVCIISELSVTYGDPARARLADIFKTCPNARIFDAPLVRPELIAALKAMALVVCGADSIPFAPAIFERSAPEKMLETQKLKLGRLEWENGFGGFDTDKNEYVLRAGSAKTPAPWCNILANEGFGTLVTENGCGYTWCGNARLMRLTPWSCDPVFDPAGERAFVRTEGGVLPLMPCGGRGEYLIAHGLGYTRSFCSTGELEAELIQFADAARPVKFFLIRLKNLSAEKQKLRAALSVRFALGEGIHGEALSYYNEAGLRLVYSSRLPDDGRTAFLAGGLFAGDEVFRDMVLEPFGEAEAVFILGMDTPEKAREYAEKLTVPETAQNALEAVRSLWRNRLSRLSVRTGDGRFDALVNVWLPYQLRSPRLMGRTGFYQSGGAVGFRDRLQDSLALLLTEPELTRGIILNSAAMQFREGDVLHWRHGKSLGVRTRISDDRLFLPFAALEYARVTGDHSIWDENVPFLEGKPLAENERDRYAEYYPSSENGSLFTHCAGAIKISMPTGENGLPLMGAGDWNDGFDEVGGESCFNGWFLLYVLDRFIPLASERGETALAEELREYSEKLRESLEKTWEGDRYLRAIRGDGTKLGSREAGECSIDLVSSVWAVFLGAKHAREGFLTAMGELLDEKNGVLKLLSPPFTDSSENSAGYIEAYVEGVRENGGQYTHAAAWAVIAACKLGMPELAERLLRLLSPIRSSEANAVRYAVEPYAVAGDVYSVGDNAGRGGWTQYTGAAGWLYQAAVCHYLGIKKTGNTLKIEPAAAIDAFELDYRFGSSIWHIKAERGGKGSAANSVTLKDDGREHHVLVMY